MENILNVALRVLGKILYYLLVSIVAMYFLIIPVYYRIEHYCFKKYHEPKEIQYMEQHAVEGIAAITDCYVWKHSRGNTCISLGYVVNDSMYMIRMIGGEAYDECRKNRECIGREFRVIYLAENPKYHILYHDDGYIYHSELRPMW